MMVMKMMMEKRWGGRRQDNGDVGAELQSSDSEDQNWKGPWKITWMDSCYLHRDPKRHSLTLCKLVKLRIRTTKSSPKVFQSKKSQRCAWSPSQLVLKCGVSTRAFYPPSILMNIFSLAECTQYLQTSTAMTLWLCTYTWGEGHYTIAFTSFSLGFLSTFSEYQTKEKLLLKKEKEEQIMRAIHISKAISHLLRIPLLANIHR